MYHTDNPHSRGPRPYGNKNTNNGNGPRKDFRNAAPVRDPAAIASALKVRNFNQLVDAAGSLENLAVALDTAPYRVKELAAGENFSQEMAYHIEQTLELQSGFLDQINPQLTSEHLQRLKSPLNYTHQEPTLKIEPAVAQHSPEQLTPPAPLAVVNPQETYMAKTPSASTKATGVGNRAARPLTDDLFVDRPILDVRRRNLAVLTEIPRSKLKLSTLLGLQPANVSHRIHGQVRLEDAQVNNFTQALGLPQGWFDTPHVFADVPAEVQAMLDPGERPPRGSIKAQRELSEQANAATGGNAVKAQKTRQVKPAAPTGAKATPSANISMPALKSGVTRPSAAPAAAPAPAPAPAPTKVVPAAPRAQARPATAAPVAHVASPTPVRADSQAHATTQQASVFSEDLQGINPIAEALLKTLALKARQGKVSEAQALELLMSVSAF